MKFLHNSLCTLLKTYIGPVTTIGPEKCLFVEVVSQSCGFLLVPAANNLRVVTLAANRLS